MKPMVSETGVCSMTGDKDGESAVNDYSVRSTQSCTGQQGKDTQFFQFGSNYSLPAFIGLWVSGWWMHDTLDTHVDPCSRQRTPCLLLCHSPNPDHHGDPQRLHSLAQGSVTVCQEGLPFSYRQLRGCQILAAGTHEDERAQIVHKAVLEEACRLIAQLLEEAPEACSAHFALSAGESGYPSLRMLIRRPTNLPCDLKPINDRLDFTKRHLRRHKRSVLHAFTSTTKATVIGAVHK